MLLIALLEEQRHEKWPVGFFFANLSYTSTMKCTNSPTFPFTLATCRTYCTFSVWLTNIANTDTLPHTYTLTYTPTHAYAKQVKTVAPVRR